MGIKIVLRKRENADGTRPLILQVSKNNKTSTIHLGYNILEKDWDAEGQRVRKSHGNSTRLNNLILKKLSDANQTSLDLEINNVFVSSKAVKQKLKPTGGSGFFDQAELYLENLKELGKHNQYSANKPRIRRFKEFLKDDDIAFADITVPLLERFKIYLKKNRKRTDTKTNSEKPITDRTVINHLAAIRSVFGFAVKTGMTEKRFSPFGSDKITIRFPQSLKIGLTAEEVKRLEELELPKDSTPHHARNLWLVSFYFAGMRVSDLLRLKWSDFQNDRLYYAMGKNDKAGSLKIPQKALDILNTYKREKPQHDLVFPDLEILHDMNNAFEVQKRIASVVRKIDENLFKVAKQVDIDKPLTMHIARHTFGNLSGDKIPIQMLQKLYRHSSVTTTISYQANFIHKDADDALDAVVGF